MGSSKTATLSLGFSASYTSSDNVTINFSVREAETFAIANTTTYALDGPQFGIDDSSKVNVNDATSNTQIFDSSLSSLVFPIGFDNVKSLNNEGISFRRKDTIIATFSHSGSATTATLTAPEGTFIIEGKSVGGTLEATKASYVAVIDSITGNAGSNSSLAIGEVIDLTATVASATSLTLTPVRTGVTFISGTSFTAKVYATLSILGKAEKVKTKVTATSPATASAIKDSGTILTNTTNRLANGQMVVASFAGTQSLQVSDTITVSSIVEAESTVSTMATQFPADLLANAVGNTVHTNNITSRYSFNDGQKDNYLDHASITLKPGQAPPANNVLLLFNYFEHTPTDGYASVESYSVDYADIPSFTSPVTGVKKELRDSLDFRPIKSIGSAGVLQTNEDLPDVDISATANTIYYLSRKDKLTLTKDRVLKVVQGVSSEDPVLPADDEDAMTLYNLDIPAYTFNSSDVDTQYIDNRRFTMRDIGKIEKRVDTLEYYTALSLLEKEASDLSIKDSATNLERFKNGILVDSFNGHNISDVSHDDFAIAIDQELKELRPSFSSDTFKFSFDNVGASANTQKTGELVTLRYTSANLVVQPLSSNTETINPYGTSQFNGQVTLSPPSDVWFSETGRPLVLINLESLNDHWIQGADNGFGKQWDDWSSAWSGTQVNDDNLIKTRKTESTSNTVSRFANITSKNKTRTGIISTKPPETIKRSVGNRAVSISIVPYVREQKVYFVAKGLKPSSIFYPYFDNTVVTAYTKPAYELTYTANTSSANSGVFNSKTGEQITLTQAFTLGTHTKTATGLALYQNSTSILVSNTIHEVTMSQQPSAFTVNETVTFYSDSARTTQTAIGTIQSYLTTTANSFTVNSISGTIATGNYATGATSGNVTGTVSDAGGFRTGEIYQGVGSAKANGNITTAPATTPTLASELAADVNGVLVGELELPATVFKSGEKLFRLTDSSTDTVASTESVAEKIFRVQGLLESRTGKISSTRPMESKRENVKEKQVTQDTINRITTSTNWVNPLTQTFIVDQNENPNGVFASSVDVFFSAIDATLPVTLAIRPIVNGFPSSSQLLPFSEITLNASETAASATAPSVATSTTYTRFTFESPVYLYPDEYAIVLTSPSTSYKVHVANLGEVVRNTVSTKVSQQPHVASFYQPQNSSVWQPNVEKQMMFRVNRCEFDTGTHALYFAAEANPLSGNTSGPAYDVFKLSTSELTFSNTSIAFAYKGILTANSNASVTNDSTRGNNLDGSWIDFSPNRNHTLSSQKKFISPSGTTGPVSYAANNFYMRSYFTSNDSKVSPAIDVSRLNLITVENLVNRGSLANSDFVITSGGSGYATAPTVTISGGSGSGATATATTDGTKLTGITVTAGGSAYYETPTVSFSAGAATATIQNELAATGGNSKARYISRRVSLEDGFDAQDIKVWLNAYKPKDTDIKVYYRVHNSEDPQDFEDTPYVLFVQDTDANLISANENDIKEYVFRTSASNISYTSSGVTYDTFKTFSIKIVLGSASTSVVPKVKDMKTIALDF